MCVFILLPGHFSIITNNTSVVPCRIPVKNPRSKGLITPA